LIDLPTRKKTRLAGYDYNQNGVYFITFCVKDRHETLGRVVGRDAPGAPFDPHRGAPGAPCAANCDTPGSPCDTSDGILNTPRDPIDTTHGTPAAPYVQLSKYGN